MRRRGPASWTGSIVLLLLFVAAIRTEISVDAQQSHMSDAAMTCKQQYRLQCLKKDINNPSFKDPICVKHTSCGVGGCDEDYYTYPKGACGLADLCWNPQLSLVKHDICDYGAGTSSTRNNCARKRSSRYQFYRRLAEKLPSPRSGGRKVRYLQHCSKPYDCAMANKSCYDQELFMPDRSRPSFYHMCWNLCVSRPGLERCAYHIYFTYTRSSCAYQDQCWEPNLSKIHEDDFEKHCYYYANSRLAGGLLRGRVRYNSSRPFVFGRGR